MHLLIGKDEHNNMTELLKRVKNKERTAQYEFYKQFSVCIFRLVYRFVSNEQDAGSIVNAAFYKIFDNLQAFEYKDRVSTLAWMKRIAVNEALMFLRQKVHYVEMNDEVMKDMTIDIFPGDSLVIEDYYNLIRKLPEDLRTVFNLYAIEGYKHSEIALHLNISESSSRVYLMRARKLLQTFYQKINRHG
jgi:RNA polymerase sigma factor (sigma-70 family)